MWKRLRNGRRGDASGKHEISSDNLPKHVAIIMDGNGRWAKSRGLPRAAGHRAGMKNVKRITRKANDIGIKVLTLYAFSTENWKRPKEEVDFLMNLPREFYNEVEDLHRENVRIRMSGIRDHLPEHALQPVEKAIEKTKQNSGLILNFALNYGSRRELVLAMREIAEKVRKGHLRPDDIMEATVDEHLQTAGLPDPDLLIRTSGELRISNFMMWQLAYSELWFTEVYWPSFTGDHLVEAVKEYQRRYRRYGGL